MSLPLSRLRLLLFVLLLPPLPVTKVLLAMLLLLVLPTSPRGRRDAVGIGLWTRTQSPQSHSRVCVFMSFIVRRIWSGSLLGRFTMSFGIKWSLWYEPRVSAQKY